MRMGCLSPHQQFQVFDGGTNLQFFHGYEYFWFNTLVKRGHFQEVPLWPFYHNDLYSCKRNNSEYEKFTLADVVLTVQMLFKTEELISPAAGNVSCRQLTAVSFSRNFHEWKQLYVKLYLLPTSIPHSMTSRHGVQRGAKPDSLALIWDICEQSFHLGASCGISREVLSLQCSPGSLPAQFCFPRSLQVVLQEYSQQAPPQ